MISPICEIMVEPWFHLLNGKRGGFTASPMSKSSTSHDLKRVLSTLCLGFQVRHFLIRMSITAFSLSPCMTSSIRCTFWLRILRDLDQLLGKHA